MTEETKLKLSLEVLQWNVIISTINPMFFEETREVLTSIDTAVDALKEQGITKTGHDVIEVELSRRAVEALIVVMQNLPYNVVARIMYVLFGLVYENNDAQVKKAVTENAEEAKSEEPETEPDPAA